MASIDPKIRDKLRDPSKKFIYKGKKLIQDVDKTWKIYDVEISIIKKYSLNVI